MAKTKEKKQRKLATIADYPTTVVVENMVGQSKELPFLFVSRGCAVIKWGVVGGEVEFKLNSGYLRPVGLRMSEANWRLSWDSLVAIRRAAKDRGVCPKKLRTKRLGYQGKFGSEIASLGMRQ